MTPSSKTPDSAATILVAGNGSNAPRTGNEAMSRLSVTNASCREVLDQERLRFAQFAAKEADRAYRDIAAELYREWAGWNAKFFDSRLKEPHITFGVTPPRSLAFCKALTDYGAALQITINDRIVFGHRVVQSPWPAEGTRRFITDILLHEVVHQWQFEVSGKNEQGYRGHGPSFCKKCNEIGDQLGIPRVIVRRRGPCDASRPTCNFWPHNVRPRGYYLNDVAGRQTRRAQPRHYPDYLILLETIAAFIDEGRICELRRWLEHEMVRAHARRMAGRPGFRSVVKQHS